MDLQQQIDMARAYLPAAFAAMLLILFLGSFIGLFFRGASEREVEPQTDRAQRAVLDNVVSFAPPAPKRFEVEDVWPVGPAYDRSTGREIRH